MKIGKRNELDLLPFVILLALEISPLLLLQLL